MALGRLRHRTGRRARKPEELRCVLTWIGKVNDFAEFERSLIREHEGEGIAIAKIRAVYKGRKPALTSEQVEEARRRVQLGEAKAAIARGLGVSRETRYAHLRA